MSFWPIRSGLAGKEPRFSGHFKAHFAFTGPTWVCSLRVFEKARAASKRDRRD